MILKIYRYLSAYNEYYEVCVERAYINMKLRIGNRKSGTGDRELVPCSLFWYVIPTFLKCKSGVRNQFPVPF